MTNEDYEKELRKDVGYIARGVREIRQIVRRADRKLDDLVEETRRMRDAIGEYRPSEEDGLDLDFLNDLED